MEIVELSKKQTSIVSSRIFAAFGHLCAYLKNTQQAGWMESQSDYFHLPKLFYKEKRDKCSHIRERWNK